MARVVDGRALLRRLVRRAQEDPLLGGRHLGARLRVALGLQQDGQAVQLHAELPQVLVLPHALVLRLGGAQDGLHVGHVATDRLLDVLLHRQGGVHLLEGLLRPAAEVRQAGPGVVAPDHHCAGGGGGGTGGGGGGSRVRGGLLLGGGGSV